MSRRHFKALAGQLSVGIAERLDEIGESAVVEAVADTPRYVARAADVGRRFKALEARRPGVLQRRQAANDSRRHEVLEVHAKRRRLEIDPPLRRSDFHAALVAACGLRLE